MLEIALCSLFTILPDYLYRRYVEGKQIGREITFYSVWFELRWGITTCLMLTVLLITVIFYYHPSSKRVTSYYRAIPIITEISGRVSEVFVKLSDEVVMGAPIFKLDSSKQEAALDVAKRKVAEVDAEMVMAEADIVAAGGAIEQAKGALQQALDELRTKQELQRRNAGIVAEREIERLQTAADAKKGAVTAAEAQKQAAQTRVSVVLPAEKESALAELKQAEVELSKTVIHAGVGGRVEQFVLKVGDFVNPFTRPAGVLIPSGAGRGGLQAGFGQIEAQVMKVGMIAEATCVSKPLAIIPMVVTDVQDFIAAGQVRAGEQLIDPQSLNQPGTILVFLEPLFDGGLDGVTPGSSCIANAYSNNHDRLENEKLGVLSRVFLHGVDAVGVVHALILRVQALMLPIQTLVLQGH